MESLGMKVLSVSLFLAAAGASSESQLYLPVKLNSTTLASGSVTVLGPFSPALCAIHARRMPSADLFCHDQGQCSVSDLKIPIHQDDSLYGPGPVVKCWTKYACVFDGVGYLEGAEFVLKCLPVKCVNGEALSAISPALTSCVAPFQNIGGGCFHRPSQSATWCNARTACIELGGDLATPANFTAFRDYMFNENTFFAWVGAKGGEWLDGTPIADDQWGGNQFASSTGEACIAFTLFGLGLDKQSCGLSLQFICELKV